MISIRPSTVYQKEGILRKIGRSLRRKLHDFRKVRRQSNRKCIEQDLSKTCQLRKRWSVI